VLILPYIEQDNAYKLYQNWGGTDSVNSNFPAPSTGSFPRYGSAPNTTNVTGRRYKPLSCPSDQENAPIGTITNHNYAVCGGNGGTYGAAGPAPQPAGYSQQPGMFDGAKLTRKLKLTDVTDGLSNTVMMAERFGWFGSGNTGGGAYSTLWANSGSPWRPQICNAPVAGGTGYAPCPVPQGNVQVASASGAQGGGQAMHTGVMSVLLGDGSVRTVNTSISAATWAGACDPRDGLALGSDW
jgi:hypothetical protein